MKFNILQQDLLPALQSVNRSVGVKSTLQVLANILIQTESNKLKLSATNLELGVIKMVNADVLETGELTVPARTFLDIISSLQGEKIEIESDISGKEAQELALNRETIKKWIQNKKIKKVIFVPRKLINFVI